MMTEMLPHLQAQFNMEMLFACQANLLREYLDTLDEGAAMEVVLLDPDRMANSLVERFGVSEKLATWAAEVASSKINSGNVASMRIFVNNIAKPLFGKNYDTSKYSSGEYEGTLPHQIAGAEKPTLELVA